MSVEFDGHKIAILVLDLMLLRHMFHVDIVGKVTYLLPILCTFTKCVEVNYCSNH